MRISGKILAVAGLAACVLACVVGAALAAAAADDPDMAGIRAAEAWAFPLNPSSDPQTPKPDPRRVVHVPGSTRSYPLAQFDNWFGAADWFPQDHPTMPRIVARGRKPAWACAFCHLPNGVGRPENAAPAGLPAAYIIEQIKAFRRGERGQGQDLPAPVQHMAEEARNVSDADLQVAADYFSKLKFAPHTRVIETATVPKTHWQEFLLVPVAGAGQEPIGERIIETSTDIARTELRDPRFGFVAYVPPGSIARGAEIASKGTGAAQACESCHGANLQGVGMFPPLAGRSPTYIVRQLILFRTGRRNNAEAVPMRLVASQLSVGDMIDAAAYAASRKP